MGVVAREVLRSALGRRVRLVLGPGPFMTALNMNGFSLSLIRLDAAREAALAAPVAPPAWTGMLAPAPITALPMPAAAARTRRRPSENAALAATIRAACDRLIALEDALNRLDARAGDGDTGSTAAAGARSVVAALPRLPLADPAATCRGIGDLLATSMGGSSGRAALDLLHRRRPEARRRAPASPTRCTTGSTASASTAAPRPGDRTLIDALAPAIAALRVGRPRRRRRRRRAGRRRHRRHAPRPRRPRRLPRRQRPHRRPRRRRRGRRRGLPRRRRTPPRQRLPEAAACSYGKPTGIPRETYTAPAG